MAKFRDYPGKMAGFGRAKSIYRRVAKIGGKRVWCEGMRDMSRCDWDPHHGIVWGRLTRPAQYSMPLSFIAFLHFRPC